MKLSGKCRKAFKEWYESEMRYTPIHSPYPVFMGMHPSMRWGVYQDFFDSVGMYIKLDPYLGGGPCLYYASICWRDENFIDQYRDADTFDDDTPYYWDKITEARTAAISKANDLYNEKFK